MAITCAVDYWNLSLNYLFIGFVLEGCTGTLVAQIMAMAIYMADNTSDNKSRSLVMVVAEVG